MRTGKKGQDAGPVAIFIILLALFIITYVLLIPSEEREQILGLNETAVSEEVEKGAFALLSASPGLVSALEMEEYTISINPVGLYAREISKTIELAKSAKVSKGLFGDEPRTFTFGLDNPGDVTDAKLFFFIKKAGGSMVIELNGIKIFEGKMSAGDLPLNLPVSYLKTNNALRLTAKTIFGSYEISDVSIKTKTASKRLSDKRTFELTASEKTSIKKARLQYFINCQSLAEKGRLTIKLNNRLLLEHYIICDAGMLTQDISPGYFASGTNNMELGIDKGDYMLEDLAINIESVEKFYPKYYFELSRDDYKSLEKENKVVLELVFPKLERKMATIAVNRDQITMDTRDESYTADITDYVRSGSNVIKVIPAVDFEIEELNVYLEPV